MSKAMDALKYAESTRKECEDSLRRTVDWILRDAVRIDEKDKEIGYRASSLVSLLGGSLVNDLRVQYGMYRQAWEAEQFCKLVLMEGKETDDDA